MRLVTTILATGLTLCLVGVPVLAQERAPAPPPSTPQQGQAPAAQPADTSPPPASDKPDFKPEELEQMLASIALYPDSLLSQMFMASTYPVEVVEADKWVKANPKLTGDELAKKLEEQPWDPSVKSLVNFPQVLAMMSENLDNTVKIGDAFIGQQKDVMDAVQRLRAKAKSTGNLESGKEQTVTTKTEEGKEVIVIESSSPTVISVPQYSPTVVYGSWPYPAYPPAPYYPPGYVAHPVATFAAGVAIGAAWGYAWGNCNWGGGDVNVDINSNRNVNRNIDRTKYQNQMGGRGQGSFQHNSAHRQGAAYRNNASAQKAGVGNAAGRAGAGGAAGNQYRGKADAGRATPAGANRAGTSSAAGGSARPSTGAAGAGSARPSTGAAGGGSARPSTGSSGGAFGSGGQSGAAARQASDRGAASRSSSPSRSAPSRSSGGSRGGGGGGRGGGGRR
jgi:hypothetical protein